MSPASSASWACPPARATTAASWPYCGTWVRRADFSAINVGITAGQKRVMAAFPAARTVHSVAGMENIDLAQQRYAHRQNHPAARVLGLGLGGLFALYLVGRGVAEFFIIHYSDPASYANS